MPNVPEIKDLSAEFIPPEEFLLPGRVADLLITFYPEPEGDSDTEYLRRFQSFSRVYDILKSPDFNIENLPPQQSIAIVEELYYCIDSLEAKLNNPQGLSDKDIKILKAKKAILQTYAKRLDIESPEDTDNLEKMLEGVELKENVAKNTLENAALRPSQIAEKLEEKIQEILHKTWLSDNAVKESMDRARRLIEDLSKEEIPTGILIDFPPVLFEGFRRGEPAITKILIEYYINKLKQSTILAILSQRDSADNHLDASLHEDILQLQAEIASFMLVYLEKTKQSS